MLEKCTRTPREGTSEEIVSQAQTKFELGQLASMRGRYAEALAYFEKAKELDPSLTSKIGAAITRARESQQLFGRK